MFPVDLSVDIFSVCSEEGRGGGGRGGAGINLIVAVFPWNFLREAVESKAFPPGPWSLPSVNSCTHNQRSEWKTLWVGLTSLIREQIPWGM